MSHYSYEDADFYEPTGYEGHIETLVNAVRSDVKAEIIHELETLRAENEKLQDVKERMQEFEREHRNKLHELERTKSDALNIVRTEKLTKLMEGLYVRLYTPDSYRVVLPKCDKCNERRNIDYLSPSGKKMEEDCSCKKGTLKYRIIEKVAVEFTSRDGKISAWYKPSDHNDSDHMVSSDHMDKLFDDVPFEEISNYYRTFFLDKEKCQTYCDWLTEQESLKKTA